MISLLLKYSKHYYTASTKYTSGERLFSYLT